MSSIPHKSMKTVLLKKRVRVESVLYSPNCFVTNNNRVVLYYHSRSHYNRLGRNGLTSVLKANSYFHANLCFFKKLDSFIKHSWPNILKCEIKRNIWLKLRYSEKATQFWKNFPNFFDVTKYVMWNKLGDLFQISRHSQNSWTLSNFKKSGRF